MIIDHKLSGSLVDGLGRPRQADKVSKDLDLALREAHDENPAKKSAKRLVRYLQHADGVNETEVYGLLIGAVESPSLSAKMSESILEAVVEFWARHSLRDRHPQYHEICYQHFHFVMAKLRKTKGAGVEDPETKLDCCEV